MHYEGTKDIKPHQDAIRIHITIMIRHLLLQYILTLIGLLFLMNFFFLFNGEVWQTLPKTLVWSGFIAPVIVFVEIKRSNLWPLYDNLAISRYFLLAGLALATEVLGFTWMVWL